MKNFCIGTLTHSAENRDKYFVDTVNSFLENTIVPEGVNWFIYFNGEYDSPVISSIRKMVDKWSHLVNFHLFCEGKNLGVGPGINKLNEYLKLYEYSLFLEGDWITLPESISGHDKNWLMNCLELLKTDNEVDQIQLRRFQHDVDDRQFGYGYWIKQPNIKKETDKFLFLNKRDYGNNPTIRRNQKHFDVGIFPLKEYYDENGEPTELKGNPYWGQAEIQASTLGEQLGSVSLKFGNFVHCDHWEYGTNFQEAIKSIKGCGYKTNSVVNCKYGFLFPREEFCLGCRKSKDFTDLEAHNSFFEQQIHTAFWARKSKEDIKERILTNEDTPPVNINDYIDIAYKQHTDYES
jgi:hypothetical protein